MSPIAHTSGAVGRVTPYAERIAACQRQGHQLAPWPHLPIAVCLRCGQSFERKETPEMIQEGEIVAVYRQCVCCGTWQPTSRYRYPRSHKCSTCVKRLCSPSAKRCTPEGVRRSRSIVLTDKGREALLATQAA